jgi:tripartite-type tricarboxylate transporter receptor subunit TctC
MKTLAWLLGGLLSLALGGPATAAEFPIPNKPIRVLVGFPPGGGTDAQARLISMHLQTELGVPVVVVNRPGASTMLAMMEVRRAEPDGHTLLYTPSPSFAQIPHTLATVQFDPFKDFTPVSLGALGPVVLVSHVSIPATNVQELVAYAKQHPGELNYASSGVGTSSHIFAEILKRQTGIEMTHVPYKGANDVLRDLTRGVVQLQFASASAAMQLVATGNLRMLGVAAPKRTALLPDVPTMSEQGIKDIDIESWIGFFGPAGMAPETVARLNGALAKVLVKPEVQAGIREGATEAAWASPQDFAALVKKSYDQWGVLVDQIGMRKQAKVE